MREKKLRVIQPLAMLYTEAGLFHGVRIARISLVVDALSLKLSIFSRAKRIADDMLWSDLEEVTILRVESVTTESILLSDYEKNIKDLNTLIGLNTQQHIVCFGSRNTQVIFPDDTVYNKYQYSIIGSHHGSCTEHIFTDIQLILDAHGNAYTRVVDFLNSITDKCMQEKLHICTKQLIRTFDVATQGAYAIYVIPRLRTVTLMY